MMTGFVKSMDDLYVTIKKTMMTTQLMFWSLIHDCLEKTGRGKGQVTTMGKQIPGAENVD